MNDTGYGRAVGLSSNDTAPAPMEDTSTVPMAVAMHRDRMAFAAYKEETNTITIEECVTTEYDTHEVAERVLASIRPSLLLVSNKIVSDNDLLEALRTPPPNPEEGLGGEAENEDEEEDTATPPYQGSIPYRLMKSSNFDVRNCKALILRLQVASLLKQGAQQAGGIPNQQQPHRHFPLAPDGDQIFKVSNFHALATVIDFESTAQVQAVGALLFFLQSSMFRFQEDGYMIVDDVVQAQVSLHMTVSADAFAALHIFATERHPLYAAKGGGHSKEGFSLFSLLDRTKSRAGRQRLREWMLKPLIDVEAIAARQDGVELFMMAEMRNPASSILTLLERVGAVEKILFRIQKCCAKPNDFVTLAKSLSSAIAIIDTLHEDVLWQLQQRVAAESASAQTVPGEGSAMQVDRDHRTEHYVAFVSALLQQCHGEELQNLFERITSIIDEEATLECKTIVIRPGHHENLDALKEQFGQLEEILADVAAGLGESIPHLQRFIEVLFLPQVGFLVALDNALDWNEEGVLPDDFRFVFTETDKSFFKNKEVDELDEKIGDLDAYIKDMEKLILADLEDNILDFDSQIRNTFIALSELDCILAFANCATDLKYVRPEVVPAAENCIQIVNGRHPLQEIVLETEFVANNTCVDSSNRVNIITGPNFSGKSCYARQVGMLALMAHVGCFIPCDEARISVIDLILVRFSVVETCAVPQSSFQLALTQMGSILRRATPNSLIIIDEFGKGTSPASGIALLTAALQRFCKSQSKVLCTTHFLEIFSLGLIQDGVDGIKALRMAVQVPETSEDIAAPLFTLQEGVASSSAGLVCARMAGVKEAVIERADEIVKAAKDRRKVQPLVEILRGNLDLSVVAKEVLEEFIGADWKTASDGEIDLFLSKVASM